jgi:N-acetylneuraminate lyase
LIEQLAFSMKALQLSGLIAATHTPFLEDGTLHLDGVESQARHLLHHGVTVAFIGGSTGECQSLAFEERRRLARRWFEVTRGADLRVLVHVGSNCLADAVALARQAQELGALGVSAFAPSYFKPGTVAALVDCCAQIAAAAPDLPFYFYDIPALTGVRLSMPEFLEQAAARIPNLGGLKFTNPDLAVLQECLHWQDGAADVLWGCDEYWLAALSLGAQGAVGSTYNMIAPLALRLKKAFLSGDLEAARFEQFRIVRLVRRLASSGYLAASKAVMGMLGVKVGPTRLPLPSLTPESIQSLREDLAKMGFFDWIR